MRTYPDPPEAVYFFGTCLIDMFYPQAGLAGIKLIQSEGVRVIFPQDQSCCGQPAYNSGFFDEARAVARKQLDTFPEDYPIVVPSGSCAGMLKHHYPLLFAEDSELERVKHFSGRIFELFEFLRNVLKIELHDRGRPITVTWHSSCHAMREMGVTEDAKSLIRQLEHVRLVELQNEHECCGFGGTFSVKHPAISAAMVADKIDDIQQTGAERLITGDCGCLMNIAGAMEYRHVAVQPQHLAEFVWERIHG
jgi:L-lactate dehydrogenase complex protein LldE